MKYSSIIISLGVLIFSSCTSCDDCCEIIDTTLVIEYQDLEGNCLLDDPQFDQNGIEIYYLENTEYEKVNLARLAHPKGFYISAKANQCSSATIFLSHYYSENKSTTLIKLPNSAPDTIVGHFNLSDGNEILESCTINGIPYTERNVVLIR